MCLQYMLHCVQVHEAGENANWRSNRYTTQEFLTACILRGKTLCPLFSVPGVENTIFRVDWLHSVDQGIGSDFLGNLFEMLIDKMPGTTKDARCGALWAEINQYYETHDVKDRFKNFAFKNIRTETTDAPKLRGCNAASCRALIRFGHEAAQRHLSDADPREQAAKAAAYHLFMVYESLSDRVIFRKEVMEASSKAFALQFEALRDCSEDPLWRIKPKMHLFLEMCSCDCRPNLFWTYRDEDFGGSIGHQSKMKGAWRRTYAFSKHAVDLFAMKNPEPRMTSM
jgi:hypothetical protein